MPHHSSEENSSKRRCGPDEDQHPNGNPYLPESLLEEIIVRLPLKSIFRFKCVSKSWLSRLCEPSFALKYQSFKNFAPTWTLLCSIMHKQEKILEQRKRLCNLSSDGFMSPTISYLYLPSPCVNKILASSNGLLLCGDHGQGRYYLYNPFIQQTLSLPKPVTWVDYQVEGLITRLDKQGVVVESYKVVQVRMFDYAKPCFLDVFCSESGSWTTYELYAPHEPQYIGPHQYRIFILGKSQYRIFSKPISLKETLYIPDYVEGIIMAYSPYVDPWKLHLIHLPDRDDVEQILGQLRFGWRRMCGSCRGRLRYYSVNLSNRGPVHKVWELIDDTEGKWCLVHCNYAYTFIKIKLTGSNNYAWLSLSDDFCPISFDPFDHDVMFFEKAGWIYSYHMATRKLELLHMATRKLELPHQMDRHWSSVIPYELQTWPTHIPPPTWTTSKT